MKAFSESNIIDSSATEPSADADAFVVSLVKRSREGCQAACSQLMRLFQGQIYRICRQYLRDSAEAEDACQETFIKAFRHLQQQRKIDQFPSWLCRVALNLCRDKEKSRKRRQKRQGDWHELHGQPETTCPTQNEEREEQLRLFYRALDTLPHRQKQVVVLVALEEMSQVQCAKVLRTSPRAVEGRLRRAKQTLETLLSASLKAP